MPRRVDFDGNLEPLELQVAHMHFAGTSQAVIAYVAECSQATISNIISRPRVAKYLIKLAALSGQSIAPALKKLEDSIEEEAEHAFEVERESMDSLHQFEDRADKRFVSAKLGAATIAQDILDRAGKRAPTKIQQRVEYTVAPATVEHLGRIINDAFGGAIDVTPGNGATDRHTDAVGDPIGVSLSDMDGNGSRESKASEVGGVLEVRSDVSDEETARGSMPSMRE